MKQKPKIDHGPAYVAAALIVMFDHLGATALIDKAEAMLPYDDKLALYHLANFVEDSLLITEKTFHDNWDWRFAFGDSLCVYAGMFIDGDDTIAGLFSRSCVDAFVRAASAALQQLLMAGYPVRACIGRGNMMDLNIKGEVAPRTQTATHVGTALVEAVTMDKWSIESVGLFARKETAQLLGLKTLPQPARSNAPEKWGSGLSIAYHKNTPRSDLSELTLVS